MADFFAPLLAKISEWSSVVLPNTIAFAVIFAALTRFPSLACNPGKPWWRNRGLLTDLCYCFILPLLVPYMRLALLILGGGLIAWFVGVEKFGDAFGQGYGPLGDLPLWGQVAAYMLLSDFLMYWVHRIFHGKRMWRLSRHPSLGGRRGLERRLIGSTRSICGSIRCWLMRSCCSWAYR